MSSLIILARPFTSPLFADSGELTRKRKQDCSGSSSDVSYDRMLAEFQHFPSSHSSSHHIPRGHCSRSSSEHSIPAASTSHLVHLCLPRRADLPAYWLDLLLQPSQLQVAVRTVPSCPPVQTHPTLPARLACPASPACTTWCSPLVHLLAWLCGPAHLAYPTSSTCFCFSLRLACVLFVSPACFHLGVLRSTLLVSLSGLPYHHEAFGLHFHWPGIVTLLGGLLGAPLLAIGLLALPLALTPIPLLGFGLVLCCGVAFLIIAHQRRGVELSQGFWGLTGFLGIRGCHTLVLACLPGLGLGLLVVHRIGPLPSLQLVGKTLQRIGRKNTLPPTSMRLFPRSRIAVAFLLLPQKAGKMCGFHTGQDPEDQPTSSYCLSMSDASMDILADIDNRISSSSSGMWPKKVTSFFLAWGCEIVAIIAWKGGGRSLCLFLELSLILG